MGKKKQKKAKCPQCKTKLIKVRNKAERYCLDCGYIEPIPAPPDESTPPQVSNVQPVGELTEEAILELVEDQVQEHQEAKEDPVDPGPSPEQLADQKATAQAMENCFAQMSGRSPVDLEAKARAKAEAEHVQRIKAKAPGSQISKGLMALREVTLYCWSRGQIRGYAYGTRCPYPNPVWTKKVSGLEAFNFLNRVKRSNRKGKLETSTILELDIGS